MFKNTTQKAGDICEINSRMKLAFNQRPVKVKLTKADIAMLDAVAAMYNCDFVCFQTPAVPLLVEVVSDTFRGGLVGKLVNLQQWYDVRKAAYSEAVLAYTTAQSDTWAAID